MPAVAVASNNSPVFILEQALTDGHYQSTVALYAAQLPTEAQVNSYAYLLAGETVGLGIVGKDL